ncbi:MAG TPA: hypothetical protein VHG31_07710, partial [Stellaceae bacterium]|nr:hypothetical protein [Stellaceae bacterium]
VDEQRRGELLYRLAALVQRRDPYLYKTLVGARARPPRFQDVDFDTQLVAGTDWPHPRQLAADAEDAADRPEIAGEAQFHLDDAAARRTIFEGLAASGWHTAALTMKLCLLSDFRPAGGIIGVGGELLWPRAVRPGDELRVEIEVLETRTSRSRPRQGLVKIRIITLNQEGDPVQTFTPTLFVDRRSTIPIR